MVRRHKAVNDAVLHSIQKAMSAVLRTLVLTTRVDTGNARANWIVTKTRPSSRTITNFPKGRGGSTAAAVAVLTIARGESVIQTVNPKNPGVWFTNNVPYIGIINDVYGDHMIERAIFVGNATLRASKVLK